MRKQLLTLCLAIGLSVPALAAVVALGQEITINGQTIEKIATKLTFDGDNVILHFSDGTSQSADMATVSIDFGTATGINSIQTFTLNGSTKGVLNISGLQPGQKVEIFDVTGRKIKEASVASENSIIDISGAKAGTYILRSGNKIIKFIKR